MCLVFVPVPEKKTVKNRIHLDVSPVGCELDEEVARESRGSAPSAPTWDKASSHGSFSRIQKATSSAFSGAGRT